MGTVILSVGFFFMSCFCSNHVRGNPIVTSVIDCTADSHTSMEVNEEYSGAVEELTNIDPTENVRLVEYIFPDHLQFLELSFTSGQSFAVVQTKKVLDAEALIETGSTLYYAVECLNTKVQNKRTLKILDLNDNPPVFEQTEYQKTISEALSVESSVVKVQAVDADASTANSRITYFIQAPEPENFMIKNDGTIVLNSSLNYNIASHFRFTVKAQDIGELMDTTEVIITVKDFDNINPYFQHSLYRAAILENQIGTFSAILPEAILAKDGDTGIDQPVVYSISNVSPDKYHSYFNIDINTGIITVTSQLDREEISALTLSIKAAQVDNNLKTADATVLIKVEDVNDNPPKFDSSSYFTSIPENSPNDSILFKSTISDIDEGGFNGTLEVFPAEVPFSLSPDGTLTVKDGSVLDRETNPTFTFQIRAQENQAPFHGVSADVNITVSDKNDNSPQFDSSIYEGKVFINQTVGIWVTKVTAEDADEGANGQVKYSIDGGNQEGYFHIDEDTGDITLRKEIPFEETEVLKFLLYVTARDKGLSPRASSVLVNVLAPGDAQPKFLSSVYQGRVQEEMDPPVQILKVTFLSVSSINKVELQIITHADKFSIDSEGYVSTLKKLDYETQKNYSVSVSLSDGTTYDQAMVIVNVTDVNDNFPVFTPNSTYVMVAEDAKVNTSVAEMAATDEDEGLNGQLLYYLQGGLGNFKIDPQSGKIFLAGELDREKWAKFQLEVVAQDKGQPSRSAAGTIFLTVLDVNDNSPQFSQTEYQVSVSENSILDLSVLTLTAMDLDNGSNAIITYRIAEQSPPSDLPVFILDQESRDIRLAQSLDFETVKEYVLLVEASDSGTPPLNGTCSVLIRVQDENDNPPEFGQEMYDVSVPENLPSGAAFTTLDVTDKDEAGFSDGHFVLKSDIFSINKHGTMFLNGNATLDREEHDNYILQVVAFDAPSDGLSARAQVNITILDINDNDPQFFPLPGPNQIPEGDYSPESSKKVCHIATTDLDQGDNGLVTLSIVSSDPNLPFQFREDGTLLAVAPLDREEKDAYQLVIAASDNGKPPRKNVTQIEISIIDKNDNDPEFSQETYVIRVLVKDAKKGDVVLTLSATDRDIGNNSIITYSLSPDSPFLLLDSETGIITLTSSVGDITEDTMFNLTAFAQDKGEPSLSSTATVQVTFWYSNRMSNLLFEHATYNFSIAENSPMGTVVGRVKAVADNNTVQVAYSLKSYEELFSVDDHGVIIARQELDRETQEWYTMAVEALQTNISSASAVTVVTVQVQDVNEAPVFNETSYSAKIFSTAPYKHPVVQVKATDPDVGGNGQLEYSLQEASSLFDVDPSTGQVYVVSLQAQAGQKTLQVKATDSQGLSATAKVEVTVEKSSSSDVVVISIDLAANTVERKIPQLEKSLGQVLDMQVTVIYIWTVSSMNTGRSSRRNELTHVGFIATDFSQNIVPSEQVKSELEERRQKVEEELWKVFGEHLTFTIEEAAAESGPEQGIVITLSVLLGLSAAVMLVTLAVAVVMFRKVKKMTGGHDSQGENMSFNSPYIEHKSSIDVITNMERTPPRERKQADGETDSQTSAL